MWPDPATTNVARARTVGVAYRAAARAQRDRAEALLAALSRVDERVLRFADPGLAGEVSTLVAQADPDPVVALDVQFAEWGEDWQLDEPIPFTYDDDDWVPAKVASELSGIVTHLIGKYRSLGQVAYRYHGAFAGYLYRVGDVRTLRSRMPGKSWQAAAAARRRAAAAQTSG